MPNLNLSNLDDPAIADLVNLGAALATQPDDYHDPDAVPAVITALVPNGYQLATAFPAAAIVAERSAPRRVKGTATVTDTVSWLAYFGKHGGEHSEVYGDVKRSSVTALLNAPSAPDAPAWGDHRVVLQLEHSPAWKAWTARSGALVGQVEFAEHIEDRAPDLVKPDAASMLELAQTIKATTGVKFESGARLHDGQRRFQYMETTEGKAGDRGQLDIPSELKIQVQVWRGIGIVVPMTARFRYRAAASGLQLGFVLDRVDDVLDAAWRSLLGELTETLPVPVLAGCAPEYGPGR